MEQSGGRPKPADWRFMKNAKRLQDMEDFEYCAGEDDRILLKSLPDQIFDANPGADLGDWTLEEPDWGNKLEDDRYLEQQAVAEAMTLQITPAKTRLMMEVDELMTRQGTLEDERTLKRKKC